MGKALDFLLPWDSQPQEVVGVNPEITPGLARFLRPAIGREIVGNVSGSDWTGYAAAAGAGPGGRAVIGSGANEISLPDGWLGWSSASVWGVLLRFRLRNTSQTNTYVLRSDLSGANQVAVLYGYVSQSFELYAAGDAHSGTVPRTGSAIVVNDTNVHTLAYIADGTRTRGFLDGRLVTDVAATTTWIGGAGVSRLFSSSGANYCNIELYEALSWAGNVPSAPLAQELTRDPYGTIFAPRPIWGPVSAGGGVATDLTIQEAAHAHGADNLALTLDAFLAVADAAHTQAADNITLTTGGANLAVDEALHTHAADNLALTLDTFLAVQDATHGQTADSLALTLDVFLAIADTLHAQAADNSTLTIGGVDLIIAEALQAHAADNLAFTLDTFLAVADALHAQTADNLTLSLGGALSDAEFRQMYDWLQDLYGRQLLTVGTFLALK